MTSLAVIKAQHEAARLKEAEESAAREAARQAELLRAEAEEASKKADAEKPKLLTSAAACRTVLETAMAVGRKSVSQYEDAGGVWEVSHKRVKPRADLSAEMIAFLRKHMLAAKFALEDRGMQGLAEHFQVSYETLTGMREKMVRYGVTECVYAMSHAQWYGFLLSAASTRQVPYRTSWERHKRLLRWVYQKEFTPTLLAELAE